MWFALLLEYLESEFYSRGVAASGLIDAADVTIFQNISAHESAHVTALKTLISGKGATPNPKPTFDFTAHGAVAGFNFSAGQYDTYKARAATIFPRSRRGSTTAKTTRCRAEWM